jgi:hypothetical protein
MKTMGRHRYRLVIEETFYALVALAFIIALFRSGWRPTKWLGDVWYTVLYYGPVLALVASILSLAAGAGRKRTRTNYMKVIDGCEEQLCGRC